MRVRGAASRRRFDARSTGPTVDAADAAEEPTPRDAELLELVGALRGVPEPQPRPGFVADLRSA